MNIDEKVILIESGFRELREALNDLSKEIWRETDPTDSSAVDRAVAFQKGYIAAFEGFQEATESLEGLLKNRHNPAKWPAITEPQPSISAGRSKRHKVGGWVEDMKGAPLPANPKAAPLRAVRPAPVGSNAVEKALDALNSLGTNSRDGIPVNTWAAMLLAVARKIDAGEISSREFEFNLSLAGSFLKILAQMGMTASNDDACAAFFELRGTNFWKLIPIPGREEEMKETADIVGLNHLNSIVLSAKLHSSLFQCLRDRQTSALIQRTLITKFLPQLN